ncbi:hypothetical protein [Streptomyces sp. CC208A]|uniref:hypothetical protein n=1 Tax=Streptomyces sp. CC208A TaxID=3044573 RepID=UPI0024A83B93|nr:hypothetical protein [Streptomyces sp. CC208A]
MEGAEGSKRAAAVARLIQLRDAEQLSAAHVRLAAEGLGVSERTVWRWLAAPTHVPEHRGPEPYVLSETDREAYALYRGNVAAVHRARQAVVDGDGTTAGAPVPDFLREGWAGAAPVALRTMQVAFNRELTPAERAAWKVGESGRRAKSVYLRRPEPATIAAALAPWAGAALAGVLGGYGGLFLALSGSSLAAALLVTRATPREKAGSTGV